MDVEIIEPPPPNSTRAHPPHKQTLTWKPLARKRKRCTKNTVPPPLKKTKKSEGCKEPEVSKDVKEKDIKANTGKEGSKIGRRKFSWVWDHFTLTDEDTDNPVAVCNYCEDSYAAHSKQHGTGNLINHLNVLCKKYPYRVVDEKQKTLVFGAKQEGNVLTLKSMSYNYEECRLKLVEMVILDELPFKIVEGIGFKNFVLALQPKFNLPCRVTVATDCLKLFHDEKKKLKKMIKSERICLTTDTWTSVQNINYMCVTGHWVGEDWTLQKRILCFCVVPDHKGKTTGKMIESCLCDWGIDKILTITVDNASTNDGAIKYLKKKSSGWKSTVLDHEFLHLRCCAHILNLIVKDGMKNQNESVLKIRNGVRYVRSSPARLKTFKGCVEIEKIESKSLVCLDIETRWNSTYLMLNSAVKFEKAFERLKEDDGNYKSYFTSSDKDGEEDESDEDMEDENDKQERGKRRIGPPNEKDWKVARSFVKFLKLFYDATLKFSGTLHVTSNMFFQELVGVQGRLMQLSKNNDPDVRLMAASMQKKFAKYWAKFEKLNLLLYVATVMDPRYKLKLIKFCLDGIYGVESTMSGSIEKQVENVLVRLYGWYSKNGSVKESQTSSSTLVSPEVLDMDDEVDAGSFWVSQFEKQMVADECINHKSELAVYLEEKPERNVASFDVLRWWSENAKRFTVVSQIARHVLAIPVSTVASESAFSTSGRILDPYRSCLNPEMVEALVCGQNWLKSCPSTIDIQESMKSVTIQEMEKYAEIINEVHYSNGVSKLLDE